MLVWLLPKPNKVHANTYRAKKLVSPFTMGVEKFMHVQIIVFCIVGILSKTWTNALFVLQVITKTIPVIVVVTFKVQVMGIKGRGRVQGIVLPLMS
jgi:hypothetical protein